MMAASASVAMVGVLLAATTARTIFEWSRLDRLTQWWHWLLLVAVCMVLFAYVTRLYRRDSLELPRGVRAGLLWLRLTALAGLLLFFFDLEKRTETENVRTSRVAVLIDTSQSMGLSDATQGNHDSRLSQIIATLSEGRLLNELLEKHDVSVYRFDQAAAPTEIGAFRRAAIVASTEIDSEVQVAAALLGARRIYTVAAVLTALACACLLVQWWVGWRGAEGEAYWLLAGTVLLVIGLVVAGVTNLRYPQFRMAEVLGRQPLDELARVDAEAMTDDGAVAAGQSRAPAVPADIDWEIELAPRGAETRLGEALRWTIDKERNGPLAGLLVVTDGCHNAGLSPQSVVQAAREAEVPLFPVGMGSEQLPRSIRLVDLELPPRVFPGDRFTITGYVQAHGLAGRSVEVSLEQRTSDDQPTSSPSSRRVTLGPDGEIHPIQFEVTPDSVGRFRWIMQAAGGANDDLDPRDNTKQGTVEVVERKSRVLLLAGGPTREYQFLRNLLFRDKSTQVDVLLQSAPAGAAQEANQVLVEFPSDRDALFEYDCLVAFDPDWTQLTLEQVRLVDEWVAEKAGGLITVAGPVNTGTWTRGGRGSDEQKLQIVKDLYPVVFISRGAASIQLGRVVSETAWPVQFTDEGQRAQFLWLEDSPTGNEEAWASFEGVYGYQALRGVKAGAQVYARFSDPQSATQDELPVYMAGQFYGAGRVFYLGSGEMWRLNSRDPKYFETFYTKLIRQVSQGRLLRDSSHGTLLVDNERCSLGDTITVRAALSDEQFRPLTVASVEAVVVHEDGLRQPLVLRRLTMSERPGMYSGQFTATREGDFRIDLAIPGVGDELLSRDVKVRIPTLEIEQPQRNDALLSSLAQQTKGTYSVGLETALGERGGIALAKRIAAKDQVTYLPGTPDRRFERRLMSWLMAMICGALSVEWLLRRLYKLA
jgi:hypothetical protein